MKKLCYYCGKPLAKGQNHREHIPPESIFEGSSKENLITVPSCFECNNGSSDDDQYLRFVVVTACQDDERAQRLADETGSMMRGFRYDRKLLGDIMSGANPKMKEMFSDGGVFVGWQPGFNVPVERLNTIFTKLTKGLFYHVLKRPLPDTHVVVVKLNPGRSQTAVQHFEEEPKVEIADGVFSYRQHTDRKDPNFTLWYITFFGCFSVLCITPTRETAEPYIRDSRLN